MLLPLSWLKEFVSVEVSVKELENKLFSSGFEIEEIKYLGAEISNCVVGQITNLEKHPDSDHLQICKLNCGEYGNDIQIVTGAQNVFVGALVPVALNNATLVGGIKIKNGKLRGVASNGMLCSGGELGITEDFYSNAGVDGILILPENTKIGEDIKKVVGLDDYVFDVSITANRPDCQSIFGMAREVSAILKTKINKPAIFYKENDLQHDLKVNVIATDICPRYMASVVDNIKIESSPLYIKQRLIKCGIQPKNIIVDITNYVLLELGQPMHAFDLNKLKNKEINVRLANDGEKITTLDEKEYTLKNNNLVIADAVEPVALAGIMGGLDSAVSEQTSTIVFESAVFLRESVRKTSRALGLASDSSHRFEKGIDSYTTEIALKRALNLICGLNAGDVSATFIDKNINKEEKPQIIKTTYQKINNILGIVVPNEIIQDILTRLEFKILSNPNKPELEFEVPPYRTDLEGAPDLAEEVIRIYGYDHIVPRLITNAEVTKGGLTDKQKILLKAKNAIVNQGFNEIITYSFYGEKDLNLLRLEKDAFERKFIKLQNPLTEDIEIMRTILAPSTLAVINKNIKKGIVAGRFFEIGNIYIPKELPITDFPIERKTISLGVFGVDEDFYTIKGAIESFAKVFNVKLKFEPKAKTFLHPYRSANVLINDEVIGFVGQVAYEVLEDLDIDQPVFLAELDYEKLIANYNRTYKYKNITKFPSIERDLAIVVNEEILVGEVEEIIKQASKKVSEVQLFDVYRGTNIAENFKSLAFRITFTPTDEPITHEEVDAQIKRILNKLNEKIGAILR